MNHSLFFRLDSSLHSLPIAIIGIGDVAHELRRAGLDTLGRFLGRIEVEPYMLNHLGLSRSAITTIQQKLDLLSLFVDDDGFVDWNAFNRTETDSSSAVGERMPTPYECVMQVVVQAPQQPVRPPSFPSLDVTTGVEFLTSIPEVVEAILKTRPSETDRLILSCRILRFPEERMTLEQLANATPVQISRERIRQKESALIKLLISAFVLDRQRKLGVALRPSFVAYWKRASEWFGASHEVNFASFLEGLQAAWDVPAEAVYPHLPLILAVLTSKSSIPEALRIQMKLDPVFFAPLSESLRNTPLQSLPLGESASDLAEQGLVNLGDLWDSFRNGTGPSPNTRCGKNLRRAATLLRESMQTDGSIDLDAFARAMGLSTITRRDPQSAMEFLEELPAILDEIIRVNRISARASKIFEMRIAIPRTSRPTLQQTADSLATYAPSVKREESVMLAALNDQLVGGDFSNARAIPGDNFRRYWLEASGFYRASRGDFDEFQNVASHAWGIPRYLLGVGAEVLWAVIGKYPGGRPARKTGRNRVHTQSVTSAARLGVIKLRGFRRVH